jgi:hypothetical protein
MALDAFCVLYAATLFPNLSAAEHLVLAAWLLEAYAVGLASGLIPARFALGFGSSRWLLRLEQLARSSGRQE